MSLCSAATAGGATNLGKVKHSAIYTLTRFGSSAIGSTSMGSSKKL